MDNGETIAYFSMEIGLDDRMLTYSGGLGVLAGDTIRSAADLKVPLVGVTLLYRRGYFRQRLTMDGRQLEEPAAWTVESFLEEQPQRTSVELEGRTVHLRAFRYRVKGLGGFAVPVYFIDADLPENAEGDRTLTHFLYGGDERYRLCQEVILGIGGLRLLKSLGHDRIRRFHLNEGHAALLALELLETEAHKAGRTAVTDDDVEQVRDRCIFTTHTPVPAGHDQFSMELVTRVLGEREIFSVRRELFCRENRLNMTYLGLNLSGYVNGVAKKHGEVSKLMFAGYAIDAITNGVHAATWVSQPFQGLFDRHMPDWREDNFSLRSALGIPGEEIRQAHQRVKKELIDRVNRETGLGLDEQVLTIGFARRATAYKRGDLLFQDLERLRRISAQTGRIQAVYAGKAHPRDQGGKELIQRIFRAGQALGDDLKTAYLEDYNMALGALITAGVDLWLNTPEPPLEASGTSGMKAALNGVPSLSVLDGWWIEGHIEGVTGWAIGRPNPAPERTADPAGDALALYDQLEKVIVPLFYEDRERFAEVMRGAIALNGSFFNTQRMMQEYVLKAYFL